MNSLTFDNWTTNELHILQLALTKGLLDMGGGLTADERLTFVSFLEYIVNVEDDNKMGSYEHE